MSIHSRRSLLETLFVIPVALLFLLAGCQAPTATPLIIPPGLFREMGYEDAVQLSNRENKPLFLVFDGDWAKDRQKLVTKTLGSPAIAPLLHDRTITLRIDVIDLPDIAKKYNITDVPTLILIAPDGKEINRWTGTPKPTPFATELNALLSGSSALQYKRTTTKPSDLVARHKLISAMIVEGQHDEALTDLLTLYHTGIGPDSIVRKKLSTRAVIETLYRLGNQHPPAREALLCLREQEVQRIHRNPSNAIAAQKLATILQTLNDQENTLATYKNLPPGTAHDTIKISVVVRLYVKQKAYREAASELTVKEALREADRYDEMGMFGRASTRVLLLPFGGPLFTEQIFEKQHDRALNRRLYLYELYVGADRPDEARQLAQSILEWDRMKTAPAAIRAATKRLCGDATDSFLKKLNLPQLAEPAPPAK